MGNMCCNPDDQKRNITNTRIEQDSILINSIGPKAEGNIGEFSRQDEEKEALHRPLIQNAIKIKPKECNKENLAVQEVMQSVGQYKPSYEISESWQDLPQLGPYLYINGATYIGQYKNSLRHGEGRQIGKDGSIYEGQWKNDKRNGKGRIIYSDGDCYEGDWVDDKTEGYGKYLYKDGAYYEGKWLNNNQHGQGKEYFSDGSFYEGNYNEGAKGGNGVFVWPEGSKYTGDFTNNDLHGYGIFFRKNVDKIRGS